MSSQQDQQVHLFSLRLWLHTDENHWTMWRAKLYHVQSDSTRYLQDWAEIVPVLQAMLRTAEAHRRLSVADDQEPNKPPLP